MSPIRPLIAATAVLTATVCAAGCGGSATTGHPRTAAPTQTTVAHVVTVPDHAQRTTSLRAVQQAAIPAAYASWLSYYDGSIWVKRDDGRVIRVDPHTNKQTGQVGAYTDGQHYCQGIGAGGGAVWSCQQGFITRIDPKTVKIIARIPIAKAFDEGRYVFADGRIWVITGTNGNQLVGIDPATNQPGPPITLPYSCTDLAPGGDAVWVLCPHRQSRRQGRRHPPPSRRHRRDRRRHTTATRPVATSGSDQTRTSSASTRLRSGPKRSSTTPVPARAATSPSTATTSGSAPTTDPCT